MLSRRTRFFALVALLTAALVPGAAVYVPSAHACTLVPLDSPVQFVPESELIVIGRVESVEPAGTRFHPEAFLKGPASAEVMLLKPNAFENQCGRAPLEPGDRALIYIFDASDPTAPLRNEAFILRDGRAIVEDTIRTEVEVVSAIRSLTGQYAVPAASESEGAGIDWGHTIIPLSVVMGILLGIGLVLMRVWHRIDPS